jgi:hypothetical protein
MCRERRSLAVKVSRAGDEGRKKGKKEKQRQGKKKWNEKGMDRPSSELISTVLTLVWTIAGIWREEGADKTGEMERLRS